jgi:hypothetical protein
MYELEIHVVISFLSVLILTIAPRRVLITALPLLGAAIRVYRHYNTCRILTLHLFLVFLSRFILTNLLFLPFLTYFLFKKHLLMSWGLVLKSGRDKLCDILRTLNLCGRIDGQ